jgi:hypothetical protein
MANWCNLRLVATGRAREIEAFRTAAGARRGRIDTRKSRIFTREMEYGEGGDLETVPLRRWKGRYRTGRYRFQGRNDDYMDHFRDVSRRFPALAFVLVYSDPNSDVHGSYLLVSGKSRHWQVPRTVADRVLREEYANAGVMMANGDIDYDSDEADFAEWEAFWKMMDLAERKWDSTVLELLAGGDRRHVDRRSDRQRRA